MEGQQAVGVYGGDDCSRGDLQVSVSFGRFDKDSLSWEKWSSFSPNKYLEEVEKCATPGSVARKAAYFEAHYRRIAARKAELLLLSSDCDAGGAPPPVAASSREFLEEEEEQNEDDMITLEKERLSFEVVLGESRVAVRCERSDDEKDEGSYVNDDLKEEEEEEEEEEEVKMLRSDPADASRRSSNDDIVSGEEAAAYEFTSANVKIESAALVEVSARIQEETAKLESWRKPLKVPLVTDFDLLLYV